MGLKDKKLAVFEALRKEKGLIDVPGLVAKLGREFATRTVRRYLAELIQEGLVERLGNKRSSRYRAIQREGIRETVFCFSEASQKAVAYVLKPLEERSPVAYESKWLNAYRPNKTFYIPLAIRNELHRLGTRVQNEDPAGTYAHQIYHRLLIDLSYNSSRLEGNTYSLLDTKKLILEGAAAEGKLDAEKIMILNHKEAIRYLVDHASSLTITNSTICTIHYLLSDGLVDHQDAGRIRKNAVRIGGSIYIPFEDPRTLKEKLSLITEKGNEIQDPYEQSLFLLAHLTYIQAFIDVNKRTARLSANIPLIQKNRVPLSFNDIDKDNYTAAALAIYERRDIQPLLDLYIFSYQRTCAAYDATVKAIGFDEVRVRYRTERRRILREVILQNLHGKKREAYIHKEASQDIPKADLNLFLEDLREDIEDLDVARLAGLGVTPGDLRKFQKMPRSE